MIQRRNEGDAVHAPTSILFRLESVPFATLGARYTYVKDASRRTSYVRRHY